MPKRRPMPLSAHVDLGRRTKALQKEMQAIIMVARAGTGLSSRAVRHLVAARSRMEQAVDALDSLACTAERDVDAEPIRCYYDERDALNHTTRDRQRTTERDRRTASNMAWVKAARG